MGFGIFHGGNERAQHEMVRGRAKLLLCSLSLFVGSGVTTAQGQGLQPNVVNAQVVFPDGGSGQIIQTEPAAAAARGGDTYTLHLSDSNTARTLQNEFLQRDGLSLPVYRDRSLAGYVTQSATMQSDDLSLSFNGPLVGNPDNIDPEREILIRDTSVVDDPARTYDSCTQQGTPMSVWSFGYLFEQIANESRTGVSGGELARVWAEEMLRVGGGDSQAILNGWISRSGGAGEPLDLTIAPFILTAIANRIDLRDSNHAGEMRFIFSGHRLGICEAVGQGVDDDFTVIFEYKMPGGSFWAHRLWGRAWHRLSRYELGSENYNRALERLTRYVTRGGRNYAQRPNRSFLNQLRTNLQLGASTWGFNEFRLDDSGMLVADNVSLTPRSSFDGTDELGLWINDNEAAILEESHVVPEFSPYTGLPMLTETVENPGGELFWNSASTTPINNPEARHLFSLNTCNSCHGRETSSGFHHVGPMRNFGSTARLSSFMTGKTVVDPVDPSVIRTFNELERRAADLDGLISGNLSVLIEQFRQASPPVH